MKTVAPGLYAFTGLFAGRVYAIEDADGVTLVDTGLTVAAERILKQLRAAGRAPASVRRILVTHAHPDHVGGLPKLKAATGAEVIASVTERPVIEGKAEIQRPSPASLSGLAKLLRPSPTTLPGTPVDHAVQDGDVLGDVMGGLRVVATPGHSPGHVAFWQPERGVLFCGDVIFNLPRLRLPPAMLTVDMAENRRSIQTVAALNPALVCFGHGNPLVKDAADKIREFARKVAVA